MSEKEFQGFQVWKMAHCASNYYLKIDTKLKYAWIHEFMNTISCLLSEHEGATSMRRRFREAVLGLGHLHSVS